MIGIICNPQSGKDIRRLLTAATTIDDTEKLNIVERIVLTIMAVKSQKIYIMPDRLGYGRMLKKKGLLPDYPQDLKELEVYDMGMTETQSDTTFFASEMERIGADAMIILGGDGTNRAAARGSRKVPSISLSTGTNNVYPEMLQGTVAGMAAAALSDERIPTEECVYSAKCIEIWKNGVFVDLALIDLVFCRNPFVGSKAIWDYGEIYRVLTTQCSMASIGFSSLVGTSLHVKREDPFGAMAEFTQEAPNTFAPMGAGAMQKIHIRDAKLLMPEQWMTYEMHEQGTLALDGEREIFFKEGDIISCKLSLDGPRRVDVTKTVEYGRQKGFFGL